MAETPSKERMRVVIAGKVPPPIGGQNINIQRVIRLLGETKSVEPVYWEWAFTKTWQTRKRFGLDKITELFRAIGRLLRIRLEGPIDHVLYSTGGPDVLPIMRDLVLLPVTRSLSRKVSVYFQAAGIARKQTALPTTLNWLNRFVNKGCWGAVVITEYGMADPRSLGMSNIKVLPYGIEDQFLPGPGSIVASQTDRSPVLLSVGHICADKGTPQLVAACGDLLKEGYNLSLKLVGECLPPYSLVQLQQDVDNAGMSDHTQYDGLLQGDALWRAYRDADLFIFPSVAPYESFGLVLLEAMMMGLPAVVTDWRANADVLGRQEPAGGVIATIDDHLPLHASLQKALQIALASRDHWPDWGARNRERYLREFSIDSYRSRLESYFVDARG